MHFVQGYDNYIYLEKKRKFTENITKGSSSKFITKYVNLKKQLSEYFSLKNENNSQFVGFVGSSGNPWLLIVAITGLCVLLNYEVLDREKALNEGQVHLLLSELRFRA